MAFGESSSARQDVVGRPRSGADNSLYRDVPSAQSRALCSDCRSWMDMTVGMQPQMMTRDISSLTTFIHPVLLENERM